MYSAMDIAGLVLGILGLSGTVMLVRYLLPRYRIASLERAYAAAYSLYQCSVSEGLLLPSEQQLLREKLRRARTDLNDVKNNVTCLGGTWRKIFTTLIRIYRNLGMIDSAIHLISVQIASSSRKGRERLEKDGILYEPCMFPLATTVSNALESFRMSDAFNVHHLFPSQEELSPPATTDSLNDLESTPGFEPNRPQPDSPPNAPRHRDSYSSTTTTVVEEEHTAGKRTCSDTDHAISPQSHHTLVKDEESSRPLDTSPLSRFLPLSVSKGVDPGLTLSNYCIDLQLRVDLLQSVLSLPQGSELPSRQGTGYAADLEKCKEDLLAVMGRLSKVSDLWTPRDTSPVLPI